MLSESRSKPTIGWVSPKILSIRKTDLSEDKAIIAEAAVAQVSQEREMVGVLWFAQWPCFSWNSDKIMKGFVFVSLYHGLRATLSDVGVRDIVSIQRENNMTSCEGQAGFEEHWGLAVIQGQLWLIPSRMSFWVNIVNPIYFSKSFSYNT